MKQQLNEKDLKVSPTQVLDYYSKQQKVEKEKIESRERVIKSQIDKATGGRNIVLSNKC